MKKRFELPEDLIYNKVLIKDPATYFKESSYNLWRCLTGEEFEKMENGISFQQVQANTPFSVNVISDPPMKLNLD